MPELDVGDLHRLELLGLEKRLPDIGGNRRIASRPMCRPRVDQRWRRHTWCLPVLPADRRLAHVNTD